MFSGIVIGAASAEALVLSVGEGAGAALDALEVSAPEPGLDVAAGWPAGAGSLVAFGLFPQAAENIQRLAMRGKASFFELLGITVLLLVGSRQFSRTGVLVRSEVANNCNVSFAKSLIERLDSL